MMMRKSVVIAVSTALASCAGSRPDQSAPPESAFAREIANYEASFQPSDYDPEPARSTRATAIRDSAQTPSPVDTSATPQSDVVRGFRVQVFSSMRIDEAKNTKAELEGLFPSEWFYLEYDPPAYKVRAGNFLTRFDADQFAKQLAEKGYTDAWTVPARVLKHPLPPPAPPQTDPAKMQRQ